MTTRISIQDITGWLAGLLFSFIGIVNIGWGNDPGFGIFVFLLSLVFYPPFTTLLKRLTGFAVPLWAKILLAVFILWSALGVGELFNKIGMMRNAF